MKRLSLVLTLAALAVSFAHAGWFRTYGGSGWDEGHCVQALDDGYVVTGSHTLSSGDVALWLFKTDTLGDTVWSKTYGGINNTEAVGNFIQKTHEGSYILTGTLWDWNSGNIEIWLLKTNEDGDTIWTKTFGETSGYCVQETQDNDYIITGARGWYTEAKLFLLKTNSNGDNLWMRTYLLDNWVYSLGYFVQQTEDHGYIVAGLIGDTTFENEKEAFWMLKTDSVGDTMWTYIQGGDNWGDYDNGRCVRELRNGGYVALANLGLLKFDQAGDTLWTRGYKDGASIVEIENGEYAFTGKAGTNLSQTLNTPQEAVWLFKATEQGDSVWKRDYKTGFSYYMEEIYDKGFILTGQTYGDMFLVKTDSLGLLGITENPIVETDNGWNVPHSIGSYIVLHYNDLPQGFRADVLDASGRKVDQIRGDGNEGAMTWGINQPPGVYFIQATDNKNKIKTAKVVLVR